MCNTSADVLPLDHTVPLWRVCSRLAPTENLNVYFCVKACKPREGEGICSSVCLYEHVHACYKLPSPSTTTRLYHIYVAVMAVVTRPSTNLPQSAPSLCQQVLSGVCVESAVSHLLEWCCWVYLKLWTVQLKLWQPFKPGLLVYTQVKTSDAKQCGATGPTYINSVWWRVQAQLTGLVKY